MKISRIYYSFHNDQVIVKAPFEVEIIKETEKSYITNKGNFVKKDIGVVKHLSKTSYPYLELTMIDADEKELRYELSRWFDEKALRVWRMFPEDNNVREEN